jgi:tetratricopeptide (TPR) repeat protein
MAKKSEQDIRFETEFFEGILSYSPDFIEALAALGDIYTRQGEYHKGLAVDKKLAGLRPDETVLYNLACSYSLTGDLPQARQAMVQAVAMGYRDFVHLAQDPDLAVLLADAEFGRMLVQWQAQFRKNARRSRESV